MAEKKTEAKPAARQRPAKAERDVNAPSEEVMVVKPAEDEPVRRGGYKLTDDGWVPEDQP